MKFTVVFYAFAALFCWAGSASPDFSIYALGFYWAALAEFVTGSLYLAASLFNVNPGWLFKTFDGRTRTAIRFFTWPYLFFEGRFWKRYRRKSREPRFEPVVDGIYIGSRVIDADLAPLNQENISAVLDLVAEFSAPPALVRDPGVVYLCLPILDGTTPSLRNLENAVEFIELAYRAGRRTLVHCTFGHGRSATVIACALIRLRLAKTGEQALARLRKCNRRIWLTREQQILIKNFERQELARGLSTESYPS